VSTEKMSWKTTLTFGKYEGKSLIAVLATDKEYLAWCFWFKIEEKYPELQWLKQNLKPKELSEILRLQDGLE